MSKRERKMVRREYLFFSLNIYNKTIVRFGFCGSQINQGLGKGYQPRPKADADNPHLDLDYSRP